MCLSSWKARSCALEYFLPHRQDLRCSPSWYGYPHQDLCSEYRSILEIMVDSDLSERDATYSDRFCRFELGSSRGGRHGVSHGAQAMITTVVTCISVALVASGRCRHAVRSCCGWVPSPNLRRLQYYRSDSSYDLKARSDLLVAVRNVLIVADEGIRRQSLHNGDSRGAASPILELAATSQHVV
jgi:hypothetical protein